MNISSVSLEALNRAFQQIDSSAARVARLPAADVDLAEEAVLQLEARRSAEAQLAVIKAEDELLGNLFDQRA